MKEEQLIQLLKDSFLSHVNAREGSYQREEDEILYEILDGELNEGTPEFRFIQDDEVNVSDSYDFTDLELSVIFQHIETGRFVKIYGVRQSYSGTTVHGVKEVTPEVKQVTIFK